MKKLLTFSILVLGFGTISAAKVKTTNNETYIPSTTNTEQVTNGGEKQTQKYSFTLFDFFFNTDTKAKTDSSQIKEKTINPVNKVNVSPSL